VLTAVVKKRLTRKVTAVELPLTFFQRRFNGGNGSPRGRENKTEKDRGTDHLAADDVTSEVRYGAAMSETTTNSGRDQVSWKHEQR